MVNTPFVENSSVSACGTSLLFAKFCFGAAQLSVDRSAFPRSSNTGAMSTWASNLAAKFHINHKKYKKHERGLALKHSIGGLSFMSRYLRRELPRGVSHFTSRGDGRDDVGLSSFALFPASLRSIRRLTQ